jgi:enoyl-CoA hydratase/carnithine racemase
MMRSIEKPIIAAVNGDAIGGGANLALACDLVIASEKARFGQTFVKVGLIPDWGGLYLLPRLVGMAKAKELIFTGKMISAIEAERIGLVNKVVPQEEWETAILKLAKELAESPPRAIGISKSLLHKSLESDIETMFELEANVQPLLFSTKDFGEGIKAFLEKRKPRFVGE